MRLSGKSNKEKLILFVCKKLGKHSPHFLFLLATEITAKNCISKGGFIREVWRKVREGVHSGRIYWPSIS